MRKIAFSGALLCAVLLWASLPCSAQEEMQSVDNSSFPRPTRSTALFAHDEHNAKAGLEDCGICHHVYENGRLSAVETSEDQQCAACHATWADARNPIPLRRAFHLRCKGCHLEQNAGPIMCAECHPRINRTGQ